jgi:DNA-binding NarL/FixJ family response regulator
LPVGSWEFVDLSDRDTQATVGEGGNVEPANEGARRKVVIADGHPIVRDGLARLLNDQPDLSAGAELDDALEAERALGAVGADALIMELVLSSSNGLDVIRQIRRAHPDLAILVFSMHDETVFAARAIRSGANGYVSKFERADIVLEALRQVLAGRMWVSQRVSDRLLRSLASRSGSSGPSPDSPMEVLTDRELEVFGLFGSGLGTKEIAVRLGLSAKTVETHRAHLKEKLGFERSSELVVAAARWVRDGRSPPPATRDA